MMQANEVGVAGATQKRSKPAQIASWIHLAGFLLIGACVASSGALLQHGGNVERPMASWQAIA